MWWLELFLHPDSFAYQLRFYLFEILEERKRRACIYADLNISESSSYRWFCGTCSMPYKRSRTSGKHLTLCLINTTSLLITSSGIA